MLGVGTDAPDELKVYAASKPALFMLFKISCPVCQMAAPVVQRLSASSKIEVIGISQDDEEGTEEFREAFGVTFPTLLDDADRDYRLSNALGITHVPAMFLVEPGGRIAMAVAGFSKRDLEAVGRLAEVPPFREGEKVPEWKSG